LRGEVTKKKMWEARDVTRHRKSINEQMHRQRKNGKSTTHRTDGATCYLLCTQTHFRNNPPTRPYRISLDARKV